MRKSIDTRLIGAYHLFMKEYDEKELLRLLPIALEFATEKHDGQSYGKSDLPHMFHVKKVVAKVDELFRGVVSASHLLRLKIIAYLHDVIEDCDVLREEIASIFGEDIAESVFLISVSPSHPETGERLKSRREKHLFYNPQVASKVDVILVKLADRIGNVSHSGEQGSSLFKMYQKEHPSFRSTIRPSCPGKFLFAFDILDDLLK